ncbi:MAG: hypothetical protein H0W36_10345 [Gemmatimonadetes bacterium]|nr:hypothetical protein [Gemmatimonadota bacterium]
MRADALFLRALLMRVFLPSVLLALPHTMAAQEEIVTTSSGLESYAEARYADAGRRDPFVPLIGAEASAAGGPRFDQLRLTGVFQGTPGNSLVVLEDPASRGWFVRVGETIGNALLIDILPDGAVFEVSDYGSVRREIVRLDRDERLPARQAAVEQRNLAGPPAAAVGAPTRVAPPDVQAGETP